MVMHDEFKYQTCSTIHYTYNEMMEGSSWCELPESVQSHTIRVWSVGVCQAKSVPTHDSKLGFGDHLEPMYQSQPCITIHHTIDETLEGLSWCKDLESIQTCTILVWKVGYSGADLVATHDSKAGEWWWLCMMNSNLNLAKPFIILIMRHWKGWDAVNYPNQSELTQSWCEKCARAKSTLTPPMTEKHIVVPILDLIQQSQPSSTIYCTYS